MCLTVDQVATGQDLIVTGSKDHYIKVTAIILCAMAYLCMIYDVYLKYVIWSPAYLEYLGS